MTVWRDKESSLNLKYQTIQQAKTLKSLSRNWKSLVFRKDSYKELAKVFLPMFGTRLEYGMGYPLWSAYSSLLSWCWKRARPCRSSKGLRRSLADSEPHRNILNRLFLRCFNGRIGCRDHLLRYIFEVHMHTLCSSSHSNSNNSNSHCTPSPQFR